MTSHNHVISSCLYNVYSDSPADTHVYKYTCVNVYIETHKCVRVYERNVCK